MFMFNRIHLCFAMLVVSLVALPACHHDSPTAPATSTLIGSWSVKTVDGQESQSGNKLTIIFDANRFIQRLSNGGVFCETVFSYSKNGNRVDVRVQSNDCDNGIQIGDTDSMTYSIDGTTLTLITSDKTIIVATRVG